MRKPWTWDLVSLDVKTHESVRDFGFGRSPGGQKRLTVRNEQSLHQRRMRRASFNSASASPGQNARLGSCNDRSYGKLWHETPNCSCDANSCDWSSVYADLNCYHNRCCETKTRSATWYTLRPLGKRTKRVITLGYLARHCTTVASRRKRATLFRTTY